MADSVDGGIIVRMFAPNVRPVIKKILPSMLDFIASLGGKNEQSWRGWRIDRVEGGWNNLLYRATGEQVDLAVKFSVADERDRAGREFHALEALAQNGLDIAPEPICLDRERYPQPVMVQSWLQGGVSGNPPTTDEGWEAWLRNLVLTHTVTPETTTVPIHPAVLTAYNADEATNMIWSHLARLPLAERPGKLQSLVRICTETDYPVWPAPSPSLCHVDSNIRNFRSPASELGWRRLGELGMGRSGLRDRRLDHARCPHRHT